MDTLGCGILALGFPACTKLLGPVVPGASLRGGARVPGTRYELDPVAAAFNIGALVRWLDFNDTWLAAEWGHPSDNLGAILAVADYSGRVAARRAPLTMRDVLDGDGQGARDPGRARAEPQLQPRRPRSRAARAHREHGRRDAPARRHAATQIVNAVSNAWLDGGALRTYRHAPNTGSRKSWAAGDATSRGVRHALLARAGEMGYPSALTAKGWGFQDVLFKGRPIALERPLELVRHGERAVQDLVPGGVPRADGRRGGARAASGKSRRASTRSRAITIETQEAGVRIIDKTGPLANPADRDHCLQYMVAVPLLFGRLTADDYEDDVARDPRIDALRAKMVVTENAAFSRDYLDPDKRAIGNAVQVSFTDGSCTERVAVDYPIGHRRRRDEGIPQLVAKFERNLATLFGAEQLARDRGRLRRPSRASRRCRSRIHGAVGAAAVSQGKTFRTARREAARRYRSRARSTPIARCWRATPVSKRCICRVPESRTLRSACRT